VQQGLSSASISDKLNHLEAYGAAAVLVERIEDVVSIGAAV